MNRTRAANILIGVTAVLLLATGALHLSFFGNINPMVESASADVKALMPALWLATGIDMVVMGLIVGAVGYENSTGGKFALAAVALSPIATAVLQIIFLGFIPPTAMLLLDGGLALTCAFVREPRRRRSTTGA